MQALNALLKYCTTSRPRRRPLRIALHPCQSLEVRSLLTAPFVLTDNEQLLLELINRARANPVAEATLQGVGLNEGLNPGEISSTPKQPLAPVQLLVNAAAGHAADMLNRDYFSHTTLGTGKGSSARANDQGYFGSVGENLSWGGSTLEINRIQHVYERHQSLFKSPAHRRNMLRSTWEEIGLSLKYGEFTDGTVYNASMAVQNFGDRNGTPYITGVVYADLSDNNFYDIGEAVRSGSITATNLRTGQTLSTTLSPSGGYALQVTSGEWSVEAVYVYGALNVRAVQFAQVSTSNVKLDFERFTNAAPDQLGISISRSSISERGADNTATLTITQTIPQNVPITVHLSTDAADALQLPVTAVIPAGELSVSVTVQGLEDDLIELPQTTAITALVYGLGSVQTNVSVLDRTFPHLPSTTQFAQTARPAIAWSAVANAASYEVWGDNTSTGQKRAAAATDITNTSWTPPADLALGDWTFYVRATAADGRRSFWSLPAVWQVRPLPAILNSGRTESRSSATLEWSEMAGADTWEIWVDAVNPRVSQIVRQAAITGTSFKLPELPVGRYTWWLRARNAINQLTAWSRPAILTITDRVTGIVAANSLFNSDLQLQWQPLPGASTYEIWVDNRTSGASGVFRSTGIRATSIIIPALPPSALRVWIRARDFLAVNHTWSLPVDFLRLLPTTVTGTANVAAGSPVTLNWTPIAGTLNYTLQVTDAQLNISYANNRVSGTQLTIPVPLSAGGYRVWLTAVDSAGHTLESSPFDLRVAETATPETNTPPLHSAAATLANLLPSVPPAMHAPQKPDNPDNSEKPGNLQTPAQTAAVTAPPTTKQPPRSDNKYPGNTPLIARIGSQPDAITAATDALFAAWAPPYPPADKTTHSSLLFQSTETHPASNPLPMST